MKSMGFRLLSSIGLAFWKYPENHYGTDTRIPPKPDSPIAHAKPLLVIPSG